MQGRTKESVCSRFYYFLSWVTCGRSRMALEAGEARQMTQRCHGPQKRQHCLLSVERQQQLCLQYRLRPGCSVPACYWLFELLTALFIVRQRQCLTYNVHFNQPGTGSYFLCWCWSDKCLPTHVSVCLYTCPWLRSECVMNTHCPLLVPLLLGLLLPQR